jgi:hypothetical protein
MKRITLPLALCGVLIIAACEDDPTAPEPRPSYQPLTTRAAVVRNLEIAWNNRQANKAIGLMDENFTFYFSSVDVNSGLPLSWSLEDEVPAMYDLFISNQAPLPGYPVCRSVRVDFLYDELTWIDVPGTASEVWYATTVPYTFTFELEPNTTYVARNGATAQLVVRQVGEEWRLVQWRDLGGTLAATQSLGVNETTWGAIKYLYKLNYLHLTTKNAVLRNLEAAWNNRAYPPIELLLDPEFTYFFLPGDLQWGAPEQWGRSEEITTSRRLLTSHRQSDPPSFPVCNAIDIDLVFNEATLNWVEIVDDDHPNETWYGTTIFYSFEFVMEDDVTLISPPGAKAQFVVRYVDDEWKLVKWRDLGSTMVANSASLETSWGIVKALYQSPAGLDLARRVLDTSPQR